MDCYSRAKKLFLGGGCLWDFGEGFEAKFLTCGFEMEESLERLEIFWLSAIYSIKQTCFIAGIFISSANVCVSCLLIQIVLFSPFNQFWLGLKKMFQLVPAMSVLSLDFSVPIIAV